MLGMTPNSVLIYTKDLLVPHLGPLFCATHSLKHYPAEWSLTKTLVLKKPSNLDYTLPSAWWPIVLSNRLAQLLNGCQMLNLVTMCEKLNLLPANHFRVRPGHTTTDSIHLLTKTVKDTWRKNLVAFALFLDVKSMFPSVDITWLTHNLRKRGIPIEYAGWFLRHTNNRCTRLCFDGYQSDFFDIVNGLNQGDPHSGILHLLYNSDLPSIADIKCGKSLRLFVDNATIIITGKNFVSTHEKVQDIMTWPNGIFDWAALHNCSFSLNKFQLLDFTKELVPHLFDLRKKIPTPWQTLRLQNHCIPSKDMAKFLGIVLDNMLSWEAQCTTTLAKGQDWLFRFKRITMTTKGIHARHFH